MFDIIRNKKGVALLMTIGILAIMSIIATSFALNMKLELEAAANYLRSVKALYLAEAGINKVIADIRSQIALNSYSNIVSSYIPTYDTNEQTIDSLGTYQVTIGAGSNYGEDQKVNLNALDDTDYVWITRLKTAGLTSDYIARIIDYRDPDTDVTSQICTALGTWESCTGNETNVKNSTFSSLEEVRLIIGDANYNNIENDITIYGPIIRGGLLAEYYNTIIGSSPNVQIDKTSFVGKIIELGEICEFHWTGWRANAMPGTDGQTEGWVETHDAEWAGGYLLTGAGAGAGARLNNFGVIFEGYLEILPSEVGSSVTFYLRSDDGSKLFIDGTNVTSTWYEKGMNDPEGSGTHTFNYPGWHPIRVEYYDNIDINGCGLKWSLAGADDITSGAGNYVPAERLGFYPIVTHPKESGISYPSAGIYSITCVGKAKAPDGTLLAEKKVTAAVKIFGVWTQTTREEFSAPWFSNPGTATGSIDPTWGASASSGYYFPGDDAYADGHVFNVTWLNSCPDNASSDLEAGGFTTTTNALKLGYWDDYDEDLAYSVVNLMAMARKRIEGPAIYASQPAPYIEKKWAAYNTDYKWKGYWNNYDDAVPNYFALTFPNFTADSVGGNNTCKVKVDVDTFTELYFEVNYNFYRPVTNIFSRAWTYCSEYPSKRIGWRGNAANEVPSNEWDGIEPDRLNYLWAWGDSHYYYDLDDDNHEWRDNNPKNDVWDKDRPGIPDELADPTPVYKAYNNPSASDPQNPQVSARVAIYTTYDPVTGWMSPPLEENYNASGAYWQPLPSYVVPQLYSYGDRNDRYDTGRLDSCGLGHYTLAEDEEGWMFKYDGTIATGDRLEITTSGIDAVGNPVWPYDVWNATYVHLNPPGSDSYGLTNVLAMIKGAGSAAYRAYWGNGALSVELTPPASPTRPNFKFKSNNAYDLGWYRYQAIWMRGTPLDSITQYWDNVRFIPDNGILASTPFYTGEDVIWGWLSWTEKNAADSTLDVEIGLRAAASKADLPTTNTGWTSITNGAQITNTGKWIQYKATLKTLTALDKDNYTNSGKTPIFQDITITYLPQVEVLYFREVTE